MPEKTMYDTLFKECCYLWMTAYRKNGGNDDEDDMMYISDFESESSENEKKLKELQLIRRELDQLMIIMPNETAEQFGQKANELGIIKEKLEKF